MAKMRTQLTKAPYSFANAHGPTRSPADRVGIRDIYFKGVNLLAV